MRQAQPKVVTDELQYAAYLDEIKTLAAMDPVLGSAEAERLKVLALLVENYEQQRYLTTNPDPIEAIELRLAELGLKQKDLADIVGSRSRASEILSRKRPLTLDMVRAIQQRLRIPADILIQEPNAAARAQAPTVDWRDFPIKEMFARGWLPESARKDPAGAISEFFAGLTRSAVPVLMRRTISGASESAHSQAAVAWIARVLLRSREQRKPGIVYETGSVTAEFMRQVAKLSWSEKGPVLAQEFLAMKGILLVIEPALRGTKIDGAAMLDHDGTPVIGLTMRFNRADNFWFTLMHELAHVQRHLHTADATFIDDTEAEGDDDRIEAEANQIAAEAFIPRAVWKRSPAYRLKTPDAVRALADQLRISPAVIAGRIRREAGNYRLLSALVNQETVQDHFPEFE